MGKVALICLLVGWTWWGFRMGFEAGRDAAKEQRDE